MKAQHGLLPAQVAVLWHEGAAYKGLLLSKVHNLGSGAAQRLVAKRHGLEAVVFYGQQPAVKLEVPVKEVLWW